MSPRSSTLVSEVRQLTANTWTELNDVLDKTANDEQVTVNTFQEPYRQGSPNLQQDPDVSNHLTFDSTIPQNEEMLYDQLAAWNQNHPHPAPAPASAGPAALVCHPITNGQQTAPSAPQTFDFSQPLDDFFPAAVGPPATTAGGPTTEVERQTAYADQVFEELFNFDACAEGAGGFEVEGGAGFGI